MTTTHDAAIAAKTPSTKSQAPKVSESAKRLVKRIVKERAAAKKHYEKVDLLTKKLLRSVGVNKPIEIEIPNEEDGSIEKRKFELVDNFAGEKTGRNVAISRFELRKVPKFSRGKSKIEEGVNQLHSEAAA